jgi:hypothetical protein
MSDDREIKPVRWIGSSRKDVRSFPPQVRFDIGQALFAAQSGETDPAAKPLKGFGGRSVMEIVAPMPAIHGGPSIQCDFRMRSMCCTLSRRSPRPVRPRRNATLI